MTRCIHRAACILAIAAIASFPCLAAADEPLVRHSTLTAIERLARDLAADGREQAMREVLVVLADIGSPEPSVGRARETCEKRLASARRTDEGKPDPGMAKSAQRLAKLMAKELGDLEGDRQHKLAAIILRLDADQEDARRALGHVHVDGQWMSPEERKGREGRRAFRQALQQAAKLEVPIDVAPSQSPVLESIDAPNKIVARYGKLEVHSTFTAEKTERILREVLRSLALLEHLQSGDDGPLAVPARFAQCQPRIFLADSMARYLAITQSAKEGGLFNASDVEYARSMAKQFSAPYVYQDTTSWGDKKDWIPSGYFLQYNGMEGMVCTTLLCYLSGWAQWAIGGERVQACLGGGLVNWIAVERFGAALPINLWTDPVANAPKVTTQDGPAISAVEAAALERAARRSLQGGRSWMQYLVSRHEDPAWAHAFVDVVPQLVGKDLVKTTFVVEYLMERGDLARMLAATKPGIVPERMRRTAIEEALGTATSAFDETWRQWILPRERSLVQRLQGAAAAVVSSPAASKVLSILESIRTSAIEAGSFGEWPPLRIDPDLSEGARAHAAYLAKHPEQAAAWPDAHEEYPDREGYSARGNSAGMHAVIAPGVRSPQDAIDGWMGTFYHRLPLIDPGLIGIGWGFESGNAILDAGSLVGEANFTAAVVWPHDGMKNVPLRFNPELPSPVPGEDQTRWGYPVTVQSFGDYGPVDLELYEGDADSDRRVDCYLSTPSHPSNPDLAPPNACCLIPKSALQSHTTYTAVAVRESGARQVWSFTTR